MTKGRYIMMIWEQMPLIAVISTQFIYAAMFLLSKAAISSGLKPCVFIAYRQAMATLALAPFAYFYHRKNSSARLTFRLLCKIFIVSTLGMSLSLNLSYKALNYVSATFSTAATNMIPAMVFILAVCLRIERLAITEKQGFAKVLGSVLGLAGAMVFTFYKGHRLYSSPNSQQQNSIARTYTEHEWIEGSLLLIAASLAWAIWLTMQGPILKEYPAKLRLMALQNGFCCITTTVYGAAVERDISSWKLGWDIGLLSIAYSGIIVSGINYTMQVWVVEKRGPVYTAIFSPLALVLTASFSALLFHDALYWGNVLGGVILVGGLYCFLWGKSKEAQIEAQQKLMSKEQVHLVSVGSPPTPMVTSIGP